MSKTETLKARIAERFPELVDAPGSADMPTFEVPHGAWLEVCGALREDPGFAFEQLTDLCGVDYSAYGTTEWQTDGASGTGFSRGVVERSTGRSAAVVVQAAASERRFAVVVHLLSLTHNWRVRLRCYAADDELPVVDSLFDVWRGADWFEREAFDLFGIVFEGHPDLRRLLTDYGFIGHPFRKDFPLVGQVEMRYDTEQGRVVYEPVSIEPRVLVPRVIRPPPTGGQGSPGDA